MNAGRVRPSRAEPGGASQVPPVSPGLLGFSALEAVIMELAWAAGGELSMEEIREHLDQHRPTAPSTVQAVAAALVRKGHLERPSLDGIWYYRAAQTPARHLGQLIGGLLGASPDRASTLALAGLTEAPADGRAGPGVRVAVIYDGCWYQHTARFFTHDRQAAPSLAGLHDAIRWHAAGLFGCPVQRVTISHAHYVAGRTEVSCWWEEEMADHGVICHPVPVTAGKGEVGGDVELALTCYQLACETVPDLIVLLAGDGDFAPLAARLVGRGLRLLVPVANFAYPRPDGTTVAVTTSAWLTRRATDTPALAALLAAADGEDYPPFLARPFPVAGTAPDRQPGRRRGTVTQWPPGGWYGFITDDDGLTWYAHVNETPRRARLSSGCPVTFTGDPQTPPGRSCPPAREIVPQARRYAPVAVSVAAGRDDLNTPNTLPEQQ